MSFHTSNQIDHKRTKLLSSPENPSRRKFGPTLRNLTTVILRNGRRKLEGKVGVEKNKKIGVVSRRESKGVV